MKKMSKKIISLLLATMIVFGSVAVGVAEIDFAEIFTTKAEAAVTTYTSGYYTYTVSNNIATITDVSTSISGAVTIPSTLGSYTVRNIGTFAFNDCNKITSLTIPSSIYSISGSTFIGCTSISNITVSESNKYYSTDEFGALFNKDKTILIKYPVGNTRKIYEIPVEVTEITLYAFAKCKNLESIYIDSSNPYYYTDEYGALLSKDKTKFIQYPAGNTRTSYEIPETVTNLYYLSFCDCDYLENVVMSDNVKKIYNQAFGDCDNLKSVRMSTQLTLIDNAAFFYCRKLENIDIPNNVSIIGDSAFYGCYSLENFNVYESNEYYSSESGVLFNKDMTTLIRYAIGNEQTSYVIPTSVTNITQEAFEGCTYLENVEIPNSVTSLDYRIFAFSRKLQSVILPNGLKTIGDGVFYGCNSLKSIVIPKGVTSIGSTVFDCCTSLEKVEFESGSNLKTIDNSAFLSCVSLTSIILPTGLTTLGNRVFAYCNNLKTVHIPQTVTSIGNDILGSSYGAYICSSNDSCYAKTYCDNNGETFRLCNDSPYKLEVFTLPDKTEYFYGDELDTTGLTLKAYYCDGSIKTISTGYTASPSILSYRTGEDNVSVRFDNAYCSFKVNVKEVEVTNIEIKSKPTKTSYFVGDTFDSTGLTLTATYNNGTTKTITSGFVCDPTVFNEAGTNTITVSYENKTALLDIEVQEVKLSSIKVKSKPNKTTYYVGDTLDTSGLTITAVYNNGDTETITSGFECPVTTFNSSGTKTISVSYRGFSTSFSVKVYSVVLSKIIIDSEPENLVYFVGDTLDTTGLTLTATYNNGTTKTITSGFTCTPTKLSTSGTQKITVTYGGKTCTFNVTVKAVELTGIEVKTNPTKTEYFVGDTLDTTGLTLTAIYNNGTTKTLTGGYTCTPTKLNTAGTQKITVTYGGKTCTFDVTVKAVELTGISVKTNPTKTTYFVGDTLDTTGLTLTATYNNGTTQTITSGFTCTPTALNTAGTQKITVTYGGKTCTFNVTVKAIEVTSLEIKTNPTKTEYFVGDALDTTGLTLTATYNNGTTETITSGFTCSPTYLSKSGTQTITVSYGGKACKFDVTVNAVEITKIEVKTNPNKMEYFVGETLNTTGLVLLATYNNGTTRDITSGYTCTPTKLETAGEQTIKVSYYGKTCEFKVTVKPVELVKIEVAEEPTKTTYYVGATLDKTGLLLTLYYSDGSTSGASSGYTCTPTKLNTVGTQVITVEYRGFTDTFDVEVIEKPEETTVPTTTRPGTTGPTDPEDPTDPWEPSTTDPDDGNGGSGGNGEGGTGETTTVPSTTKPNGSGTGGDGNGEGGGSGSSGDDGEGGNGSGSGAEEPNPDGSYDVYFYVDGEIYAHYRLLPGNPVPVPAVNPVIDGLIFLGWTPAIEATMPEHDLAYYASFHGHSYTYTVTDEPDCENHGSAIYTCSCGKSYTVTIPALGHAWGAWTVVVEATATSNGLEKRVCSRCGKEEYRDISAPEANFYVLDIEDQEYTGYPLYPAVKVYSLDGERLDECYGDSPDENGYMVGYVNNSDAGIATVTVTGIGEYYGVIRKTFNIVRKDISDLDHAEIPDITDNGGESTPDPVITDNGRVLEKDKDYVLEYENNGGAGRARIIVTGIGNYTGTLIIVFNIVVNDTSFSIPVIGSQVYTGGKICPEFNLFDNGSVLKEGVHYTVEYADNINVGYGRIIITGLGNYSGTIVIIFRIVSTEITKAEIPTLPDAESSEDYTPDFNRNPIIFNGKELEEGIDYRVVVLRNIIAGYYEIIIIGIGNFTGTITIYVNIIGTDISKGSFTVGRISDVMYQGVPVTPEVSVYSGGVMLERNVDYIVEYRNNNAVGTAMVIIRGIGAYRGIITKTFLIYADNRYSVRISTSTYELKYEQAINLTAEVTPESNRNFRIVWSSSDPTVATVDQNGRVTARDEGNVIISATLYDEDGRVVTDPYGMEISEGISIKCTMTIWQKIIRFFRNLFSIFSFNSILANAFKAR